MKTKVLVPSAKHQIENRYMYNPKTGDIIDKLELKTVCAFCNEENAKVILTALNGEEREVFIIEESPKEYIEYIESTLDFYWDSSLTKNQTNDLINEVGLEIDKLKELLTLSQQNKQCEDYALNNGITTTVMNSELLESGLFNNKCHCYKRIAQVFCDESCKISQKEWACDLSGEEVRVKIEKLLNDFGNYSLQNGRFMTNSNIVSDCVSSFIISELKL